VVAGAEIGLGPVTSLTAIYIVEGKPSYSSNLVAAQIKRHPRYDYRIKTLDDEGCTIQFFQEGKMIGEAGFSKADAQRAGLLNKFNWKTYPRNMYFSRALTNGARWYCPDVFIAPVYTPEELNPDIQLDESGEPIEIVDAEVREAPPPKPQSKPKSAKSERPMAPEALRNYLIDKVAPRHNDAVASTRQRGLCVGMLNACFAGDENSDNKRHSVLQYLFGENSMNDVGDAGVLALLDWLNPEEDSGGAYTPDPMAVKEALAIYRARLVELGQAELL